MTHEQIEEYLKDKNLDWQQYQIVLDAMAYAEQKVIDKACNWLEDNLFNHAQDEEELEIEWDSSITTNLIVCDYFNSKDDCINDFRRTLEE